MVSHRSRPFRLSKISSLSCGIGRLRPLSRLQDLQAFALGLRRGRTPCIGHYLSPSYFLFVRLPALFGNLAPCSQAPPVERVSPIYLSATLVLCFPDVIATMNRGNLLDIAACVEAGSDSSVPTADHPNCPAKLDACQQRSRLT